MEQKQMEKKLKSYLKAGKGAARGSKRASKKLRKMATNDMVTFIAKKATNHPEWYTKLGGELIGLNFGAIDQIPPRTDLIKGRNSETINLRTTTDAIILIALTATSDDTVRVAAQKIVNELRLVSGANTIYNVDDMVEYMLNIRSIWAALTQVRRAIRCLNITDPHDIDAWRKYLLMALNVTSLQGSSNGFAEEFRQNAAAIVNWLNTIVKSVRFMMPGNFALFERTSWLLSNIFTDGVGKKFGAKMFVAPEVPTYTTTSPGVQTGTVNFLFGPTQTVKQMEDTIAGMITTFTSKTANIAIAGDLMKAYGMKSFYDPGQISFTETVPMIYDERALEQIMNADIVGVAGTGTNVYGYGGNYPLVLSLGTLTLSQEQYASRSQSHEVKLVNTSDNDITPGETLSLTRLKASTAVPSTTGNLSSVFVVDCGTEVVVDYVYLTNITIGATGYATLNCISSAQALSGTQATFKLWMSCWALDDYGPCAFMYDTTSANLPDSGSWEAFIIEDLSNWALMSRTEQRQFHKTAVLSLMTPSASVVQQAVAKL